MAGPRNSGNGGQPSTARSSFTSSGRTASTAEVSPMLACSPVVEAEIRLRLVGRQGVPVGERPGLRPLRQLRRGVEAGEVDRGVVRVVAVHEDDAAEARLDERVDQVLDERHVRGGRDVAEPGEAAVTGGEAVRDRRRDERRTGERHAPADLPRDDHVRPDRAVRAVLLGRAGRDQQRVRPSRDELGHLRLGQLVEEDARPVHRNPLARSARARG